MINRRIEEELPSVPGTILYGFLIGVGLAVSYFVVNRLVIDKIKIGKKQ